MKIDLVNGILIKNTIRVTRNKLNILFRSIKHDNRTVTKC